MMQGEDRGQIQFDFAVGVSILVMTIIVAFTFVPGLFGGMTEGRVQGDQVAADRVAAWLAEDALGDPSTPNQVDADCVIALFDESRPATGTVCGFSDDPVAENIEREFVDMDRSVHVAVWQSGDQVSWEDGPSGDGFNTNDNGVELQSNNEPGGSATVSAASRPVDIDGYHATIRVRVW